MTIIIWRALLSTVTVRNHHRLVSLSTCNQSASLSFLFCLQEPAATWAGQEACLCFAQTYHQSWGEGLRARSRPYTKVSQIRRGQLGKARQWEAGEQSFGPLDGPLPGEEERRGRVTSDSFPED